MKKNNPLGCFFTKKWRKILLKMKILSFLILVLSYSATAKTYSQQQRVSMEMEQATILEVLNEIKEQTGLRFVYYKDMFDESAKMDVEVENEEVKQVLDELLRERGLECEVEEEVITFRQVVLSAPTHVKQEKNIVTGKVTDKEGVPIPGVSVLVKGTTVGVATDVDGLYSIEFDGGNVQLVFSFVGMLSQEITYSGQEVVDVTLTADSEQMEEIVIVGYGKVDKRDLTGTVSTVKSEELALVKTQSVESALAGQVAGLHIATSNGQPGKGSVVHIRGLSQIKGDNQPLYVVDGVPIVTNPAFGTFANAQNLNSRENPLLAINPDNVERIDVLKDASAAAIYGSRAANGVILITTKRGSKNQKPIVRFSTNAVIQNPVNTHDFLNAEEYIAATKAQATVTLDNSPYPPAWWPFLYKVENAIINDPDYFGNADMDWQDEIINKNALWMQYNLSVSGGTDKTNYMMSASVSDQEGVLIGNDFKRYSFSSNLDSEVTERLKLGASISYNHSTNNTSGVNSLINGNFRPDVPMFNEDGSKGSFYNARSDIDEINPVEGIGKASNKTIAKKLFGSIYADFKILDGLNFKSQLNVSVGDATVRNFNPSFNRAFYARHRAEPGAVLNSNNNNSWTTSFENTLNFSKTINEVHRVNSVIGISWDRSRYDLEGHRLRIFPDDKSLINQNSASIIESPVSDHFENALNSQFGRINYVYDNRYMATFTARRDGSIKFGSDNRYGFFPSGALAWNVHNETFMNDIKSLDKLKLRASLGRTGSDNLPAFSYLAYYQAGNFYNGVNAIGVTGVPNSKIKWETTNQLDLGLEFSLFNYRINAEIVYFEKNTSDIILYIPIPFETGSTHRSTNVADVSNKGWEFAVNGDVLRGEFTWNSAFNISFIDNKVEKMNGGATETFGSRGIVEGEPIGVITGYDVLRIAQNQQEIDDLNAAADGDVYQSSLTQPGDYIFRDVNGDDKITGDDRIPLGDITPDFFGGWNNRFSYKNLSLGMNWVFSYGAEKEYTKVTELHAPDLIKNFDRIVLDTWTPENTDATYARWGSPTNGRTATSRSVEDASYIKLQSLSLAYNLPKTLLNKLGLTSAKLSLIGNNLITITDYPGLDPQDASTRFSDSATQTSDNGFSYPNTRTYSIGLNVTF
ncbi:SusC/RagA family TonB-linked outer membrane protein [Marinifilum sp.]|uniref:SusC/RagA family TonB-linked outer membrane protein n=1 Tax=Marinifilum sp. TaxID=2033137 RepID=UPI003BABCA8D